MKWLHTSSVLSTKTQRRKSSCVLPFTGAPMCVEASLWGRSCFLLPSPARVTQAAVCCFSGGPTALPQAGEFSPKADRAPRLSSLTHDLSVALRHRTAARSCGRSAETSRSSHRQTPPLASWSSAPWMEASAASAARENWWVEIQADARRDFKAEMRRSCSWRNLFPTNSNLFFLSG